MGDLSWGDEKPEGGKAQKFGLSEGIIVSGTTL
jgi:hypothetical protein